MQPSNGRPAQTVSGTNAQITAAFSVRSLIRVLELAFTAILVNPNAGF